MSPGRRGRPVAPCKICGGAREPGQRVKVAGKQVPCCASCARKTREWKSDTIVREKRRGTGRAFSVPSSGADVERKS